MLRVFMLDIEVGSRGTQNLFRKVVSFQDGCPRLVVVLIAVSYKSGIVRA